MTTTILLKMFALPLGIILTAVSCVSLSEDTKTEPIKIILHEGDTPPGSNPRSSSSLSFAEVSASYISEYLFVNIDNYYGTSIITIEDNDRNIVAEAGVIVNESARVTIPLKGIKSGNYNVKIEVGAVIYCGEFLL